MNQWAHRMRELVNEALERALPPETAVPGGLHKAMRYAVFPGGKRIRPLLALGAALAVERRHRATGDGVGEGFDGGDEAAVRRAMPCAVAVELVHSYSLIHDDLPAMDDDDFRRGRPTVHKAFGEALAILAGDALLPLAFEVLTGDESRGLMGPETAASAAWELARAAGSLGMVGGQAIDIGDSTGGPECSRRAPGAGAAGEAGAPRGDEELLLREVVRLADLKTGAIIRAAVRCGAIALAARPDELDALTRYGSLFGRAFQVFDDLDDVEEGNLLTFSRAMGTSAARHYGEELLAQAEEALSLFAAGEAAELCALARALGGRVA
ncbi:MAG: polyprenyl synthetase family protein [Betaproteobacteria bacterium]